MRRRLDIARVLVTFESRMKISSAVSVNFRGKLYKILVSIEDDQCDDFVVQGTQADSDDKIRGFNSGENTVEVLGNGGWYSGTVGSVELAFWNPLGLSLFQLEKCIKLLEEEHAGMNVSHVAPVLEQNFNSSTIAATQAKDGGLIGGLGLDAEMASYVGETAAFVFEGGLIHVVDEMGLEYDNEETQRDQDVGSPIL
ncbi:hypothetical protein REPUB_Repub18cG0045700 [Reevesia pubescens]